MWRTNLLRGHLIRGRGEKVGLTIATREGACHALLRDSGNTLPFASDLVLDLVGFIVGAVMAPIRQYSAEIAEKRLH